MPTRRTILETGAALGGLTVGGLSLSSGTVAAESQPELAVNEFGSAYPGENALGEWSEHVAFEGAELSDETLRLEYDDGGFFATNVFDDVSDFTHLFILVRGDEGGEEEDVQLEIGGVQGTLADMTDGSIGTEFSGLLVDLEANDVDRSSVDDVELNFWQGASGAIELQRLSFRDQEVGGDPSDIQPETTVAEFLPEFEEYTFMRGWRTYLPGETSGGYEDLDRTNVSDEQKASEFEVDLDAVMNKTRDGSITFDEMGTQALTWARQFEEEGFPRRAIVQLLPRLSLLPEETEEFVLHDPPSNVWDQTAGPVEATNGPDQLIQEEWAPDARSYRFPGKMIRDRSEDQIDYENDEGYWSWYDGDPSEHEWFDADVTWTKHDMLPDDLYRQPDNPLHDIADNVHPATGEDLGGDGFTANAPMTGEARIHEDGSGYWNQYLEFENTSDVPYSLDAAVIMWIGPSGANGNLRDGHFNNEQRPHAGLGHPQRDVIEIVHDEEENLSAYAVRPGFHDEPVNMRTSYPNQKWSLEIGMPSRNDVWSTEEERQALVDTMLNTLHVEVETGLDRNIDLVDAVGLRNRMSN